jgi:hypothetical protein
LLTKIGLVGLPGRYRWGPPTKIVFRGRFSAAEAPPDSDRHK